MVVCLFIWISIYDDCPIGSTGVLIWQISALITDIAGIFGHRPGRISVPLPPTLMKIRSSKAVSDISAHGLDRQIKTVLSDGLKQVDDHVRGYCNCQDGLEELISSIISAVEWLKNPDKRLILRPMTIGCLSA